MIASVWVGSCYLMFLTAPLIFVSLNKAHLYVHMHNPIDCYPQNPSKWFVPQHGDFPNRSSKEYLTDDLSRNPSKPSHRIKRVLKVNSKEILGRFERERERIKKYAYEQQKRHPRSIVDGNELLLFYGTTISCRSKNSKRDSELCRDPACFCRIIQSNFDTKYTKN